MTKTPTMNFRQTPRLGLNRAQLALSIGVSPNSVDLMVREGALPPPRVWHSRKIWIVSEVEAAMMQWPTEKQDDSGFFEGATV